MPNNATTTREAGATTSAGWPQLPPAATRVPIQVLTPGPERRDIRFRILGFWARSFAGHLGGAERGFRAPFRRGLRQSASVSAALSLEIGYAHRSTAGAYNKPRV